MMAHSSAPPGGYARQSANQRAHGGGIGRSALSFWKHEAIKRAINRQIPVLGKRGRGLIIDMHAGDGEATPHIQPDLFSGDALITTPHLAIGMAERWGADVWLCEISAAPRKALAALYGDRAEIIGNHDKIAGMTGELAAYSWVIAVNDPNGHGHHGVDVMQAIASANPVSDFIVVVNRQSIARHLGVKKLDYGDNAFAKSVADSRDRYAWMVEPNEWARHLEKRQVLATEPTTRSSNGFKPQILLISNFIPGHRA